MSLSRLVSLYAGIAYKFTGLDLVNLYRKF